MEYAERFIFDRKIILDYLADKFSLYNFAEYSAIVLGCTHFIYYRDFIKESVLDCIDIVDGNYGTIKHLKNLMKDKLDQNDSGKVEFFQSAKNGVKSVRFDKYMNLL